MKGFGCVAAAGFAVAGTFITAAGAQNVSIFGGHPCKKNTSYCVSFIPGDAVPDIAQFSWTALSVGSALVTFSGQMTCENDAAEDDSSHGTIDLSGQIVEDKDSPPDYLAPGGERIGMQLPPASASAGRSQAVNLNVTRVFSSASQATHTYRFRLAQNRMHEHTFCIVFNGTISVIFVPETNG